MCLSEGNVPPAPLVEEDGNTALKHGWMDAKRSRWWTEEEFGGDEEDEKGRPTRVKVKSDKRARRQRKLRQRTAQKERVNGSPSRDTSLGTPEPGMPATHYSTAAIFKNYCRSPTCFRVSNGVWFKLLFRKKKNSKKTFLTRKFCK